MHFQTVNIPVSTSLSLVSVGRGRAFEGTAPGSVVMAAKCEYMAKRDKPSNVMIKNSPVM